MTARWTAGAAVVAALLGAAVGYAVGRCDSVPVEVPRPPERAPVIKVTPRQVRAAQISIKAHRRLGKPVPPGLRRIAAARRLSLPTPAESVDSVDVTRIGERTDTLGVAGSL